MSDVFTMQDLLAFGFRSNTLDAMDKEILHFANHDNPRVKSAIWNWARNAAQGLDAGVPYALVGEPRSALIRAALLRIVNRARDHIWEKSPSLKQTVTQAFRQGEVKFFGQQFVLGPNDRFGSPVDGSILEAKDFLKDVLAGRQDVYEMDVYQDPQISAHNDTRRIPVELETALEGYGFQVNQDQLSSNWKIVREASSSAYRLYQQGDFEQAHELSDLALQLVQRITERFKVIGSRYNTGTFTFEVPAIGHHTVQGQLDEASSQLVKNLKNTKEQSEVFLALFNSAAPEVSLPLH